MRQRVFTLLVLALIISSFFGVIAYSSEGVQHMGKITVYLEGEALELDQAPYIKEGRAMVPLRGIMEALDASVKWHREDDIHTVTIIRGARSVELTIHSTTARIDHEVVELEAAPEIVSDLTFVPLRFVTEAFGAETRWDGEQRRIDITRIVDVKKITVVPGELMLQSGQQKALQVEIEFQDGSTETVDVSDINWSSSQESIAQVADGVIFGFDEGTTLITAEYRGHQVSARVEVVPDLPVEFSPDNRRLESVIRNELDKPTGTIYRSDLAEITHLTVNDARIESLEEIQYCINLKTLSLIGNRISDLDLLVNLTKLERLELGHNQISDLEPLSHLESLEWLALNDNRISDIGPLSELPQLTWLSLSRNEISRISGLAGLNRLESLDISGNAINSLNVGWDMPVLSTLLLRDNQLNDLSPLKNMKSLSVINVSGNRIQDISALMALPRLMWLAIYDNDSDPSAESSMQRDVWRLEDRGVYVQMD